MDRLKQAVKEAKNEASSLDIIKDVIATNWSKDNEEQLKIVQLLKGLALSDEEAANKFMQAIDKFTSSLKPEDFE